MHFIYKNDNGGIAVGTIPTDVEDHVSYAKKFTPAGRPFKIVSAGVFPQDRSQRDAWAVDDVDLTDGIGEGAQ